MQSCKEGGQGNLEMVFKLEYDGKPLVAGEKYNYPLGFEFFITKYSMFLSEVAMLKGEASIEIAEALFMDLAANQSTAAEAAVGTKVILEAIPEGTYKSINMSIGLPSDLNATSPSDYTSSSPLSNTGEYWEGWSSYIFHKIEGKMDSDADGSLDAGIALHIGSNDAYRNRTISKIIEIMPDQTTSIEFVIDLKEVLQINNQAFDLQETPQVHHLGVLPKVLPLMDNLIEVF